MENTSYPCPACGASANLVTGCSGCGLGPYPPAAEVVRLDRQIGVLDREVEQARQTYQGLLTRLDETRHRRAELAAGIRARFPAPAPPRPVPVTPVPPPGRPETSTRTVQGLLFVLGGLLLGTAAIVFTAVAWASVGVAGRALILAAFTGLALAVPLVTVRRGLRGTAETFAAVGLLLVLLDGYAAWTVNLAGVAGWPESRYAGLVGAVSAAVAAGYARLSRLTVPWFAALLVAQPVLPLLAMASQPSAAGWALVLTGVALGDLLVVVALRHRGGVVGGGVGHGAAAARIGGTAAGGGPVAEPRVAPPGTAPSAEVAASAAAPDSPASPPSAAPAGSPGTAGTSAAPAGLPGTAGTSAAPAGSPGAAGPARGRPAASAAVVAGSVLGWVGYGVALVVAAGCALVPLAWGRAAGTPLLAGGPLLVVALALLAGALLAGGRAYRLIASGALVPVLATALIRPVAELRPGLLLVAAGLVVTVLAGAVRWLPERLRTGPRVGALLVAAGLAVPVTVTTAVLAGAAVFRSLPPWRGADPGPASQWGWQLPVAVLLTAGAVALLLPRAAQPVVGVVGGALAVLAAPAVAATPWSVVVAVDLAAASALLLAAVLRPRPRYATVLVPALAGAILLCHGLLVGLADPAGAGAALAVVGVTGAAVAARGRRGEGVQPVVAGVALAAAFLAVPAGVVVGLIAADASPWWQARAAFAAAGLLVLASLAVRRQWPDLHGYASTGLAVALAVVGAAPVAVPGAEPVAVYAALAALLAVLAGAGERPTVVLRAAGAGLAGLAVLAVVPVLVRVLAGQPVPPWSGVPAVVPVPGALAAGVALLVLAAVGAAYARTVRHGWALPALAALPPGAVALPLLLVAAGAPWPVVPGVLFGIGVAALLVAALAAPRPYLVPVLLPVGLVLTGPGLAGLVATRAGTLAALGALLVAAMVVGAAGRRADVRLAGWLLAVPTATSLAVTASLAGGLPLRTAAFAVLAVAVLVLAAAPVVAAREAVSGRALEAAAQAVALVALLLTGGALRYAAAVSALWGVAVGLRVLRRGESTSRRWAFAAVAGGSELLGAWLLLLAGGVVLLEAYTVPAAALALGAGLVALRTRPGLNSWLALGPGLAAALLPSLVSVLVAPDPQPWRRLALGVAALAAVLAGAVRRWQAPVLLGSAVLVPLALHELARGWDLLPRWVYLAVGGLALIALAATYERRRRDLARLRTLVGRMG